MLTLPSPRPDKVGWPSPGGGYQRTHCMFSAGHFKNFPLMSVFKFVSHHKLNFLFFLHLKPSWVTPVTYPWQKIHNFPPRCGIFSLARVFFFHPWVKIQCTHSSLETKNCLVCQNIFYKHQIGPSQPPWCLLVGGGPTTNCTKTTLWYNNFSFTRNLQTCVNTQMYLSFRTLFFF